MKSGTQSMVNLEYSILVVGALKISRLRAVWWNVKKWKKKRKNCGRTSYSNLWKDLSDLESTMAEDEIIVLQSVFCGIDEFELLSDSAPGKLSGLIASFSDFFPKLF